MCDLSYNPSTFDFDGDKDLLDTNDHVIQNLSCRLDTVKGEHFYWTEYGTELYLAPGLPNSQETHMLIIDSITDGLKQDTRIPSQSSIIKLVSMGRPNIDVSVLVGDKTLEKQV